MVIAALVITVIAILALGLHIWGLRSGVIKPVQPKIRMIQFGKFVNRRPGIKSHAFWTDEPDVVEFTDYKYWIRLKPNPGFNLPKIGYWSKARGRKH